MALVLGVFVGVKHPGAAQGERQFCPAFDLPTQVADGGAVFRRRVCGAERVEPVAGPDFLAGEHDFAGLRFHPGGVEHQFVESEREVLAGIFPNQPAVLDGHWDALGVQGGLHQQAGEVFDEVEDDERDEDGQDEHEYEHAGKHGLVHRCLHGAGELDGDFAVFTGFQAFQFH